MSTGMIIVIVTFFVLLFTGFPVVYALGLPSLVWLAITPNVQSIILPTNMLGYVSSFTLLCLPGFMLVGRLMETCGITDRLFNFCTALGMGEAHIVYEDGTRRDAACIGGMLSMLDGTCHLLATTWEWKEDIDEDRANAAKKRAEEVLSKSGLSDREYKRAEAKLHRALVRLSVKK